MGDLAPLTLEFRLLTAVDGGARPTLAGATYRSWQHCLPGSRASRRELLKRDMQGHMVLSHTQVQRGAYQEAVLAHVSSDPAAAAKRFFEVFAAPMVLPRSQALHIPAIWHVCATATKSAVLGAFVAMTTNLGVKPAELVTAARTAGASTLGVAQDGDGCFRPASMRAGKALTFAWADCEKKVPKSSCFRKILDHDERGKVRAAIVHWLELHRTVVSS